MDFQGTCTYSSIHLICQCISQSTDLISYCRLTWFLGVCKIQIVIQRWKVITTQCCCQRMMIVLQFTIEIKFVAICFTKGGITGSWVGDSSCFADKVVTPWLCERLERSNVSDGVRQCSGIFRLISTEWFEPGPLEIECKISGSQQRKYGKVWKCELQRNIKFLMKW